MLFSIGDYLAGVLIGVATMSAISTRETDRVG